MNNKKAIAHFRQLCCSRLPQQGLAPALMEALHYIVPSLYNRIVWCDERRAVTGIFCEDPRMYLYSELFLGQYNNRLRDFPGTDFAFARPRGAGHYQPYVSSPSYFSGVYHNEIERPVGGHHFMDMAIADERGNLGLIFLTREQGAKAFSQPEIDELERLIPYVAHALRQSRAHAPDCMPSGKTALLVADFSGRLRYATATAMQWLSMAFFPDVTQGDLREKMQRELPPRVRALCRAFGDIRAGRYAPPPAFSVANAWGRFDFVAEQLLDRTNTGGAEQVAICVSYHEPKAVALMRKMWTLGLSSSQKQLCLVLMRDNNATEAQLAQQLGTRPSTVRDHLGKIYSKLEIHSREELVQCLGAPAAGSSVH